MRTTLHVKWISSEKVDKIYNKLASCCRRLIRKTPTVPWKLCRCCWLMAFYWGVAEYGIGQHGCWIFRILEYWTLTFPSGFVLIWWFVVGPSPVILSLELDPRWNLKCFGCGWNFKTPTIGARRLNCQLQSIDTSIDISAYIYHTRVNTLANRIYMPRTCTTEVMWRTWMPFEASRPSSLNHRDIQSLHIRGLELFRAKSQPKVACSKFGTSDNTVATTNSDNPFYCLPVSVTLTISKIEWWIGRYGGWSLV